MIKDIVILTGAGISAESGIQTFRGDGLWCKHDVNKVATMQGFIDDPDMVNKFYSERVREITACEPNLAHIALTKLSEHEKYNVTIITQNIDDLHERAGCTNVIHIHGSVFDRKCLNCEYVTNSHDVKNCERCSYATRPDIVWFGENVKHLEKCIDVIKQSDFFISIGTSGLVYPVAEFVSLANSFNAKTVELNLEKCANSDKYGMSIYGKATETVPSVVEELLNE